MEKVEKRRSEALRDLKFIRSMVFETREGARGTAPFLMLWGIIWLVGYLSPLFIDYHPLQEGSHWLALAPLGGVLSAIIGRQQKGPIPFLLKVVFTSWIVLAGFGLLTFLYLLPGGGQSAMAAFWPLLIGACYLVGGTVLGREMLGLGALLVAISLVGAQLTAPDQALLFGLGGGGALLLSGLALRRGASGHAG